ncbi:MAG: hypothetical protein AAF747_00035 [Planctomycetota bacterium]
MTELLYQLFGVERFDADGPARLDWATPLSPAVWIVLGIIASLAAWATYRRLEGAREPRIALAGVRTLTILALLALALGPQLVQDNQRTERDWIVVLADRSASMSIPDASGSFDADARVSRDEQLREAVRASWPAWRQAASERNVLWLGFDSGVFELAGPLDESASSQSVRLDLGDADGLRTDLNASLAQAFRRVAARPVSGFVLLTDGRSAAEPSRETLQRLQAEGIGVYPVPLGSPTAPPDLAVASVDAPPAVFVDDVVPISVSLGTLGDEDAVAAMMAEGVRVELVDTSTGIVLDDQVVRTADEAITLLTQPTDAEQGATWAVRVVTARTDLIESNNSKPFELDIVDQPLRVLYVDGYPRWTYRYLKNILLRESSVRSSSLLLAPNRSYIQEGDVAVARLPRSPEEWAEFDVIVLGDVRAELFGLEQLEQLRAHVADRGAGLVWIGGPASTPATFAGTPLADLLPFTARGIDGSPGLPSWNGAITLARTDAADRLGVLRLGETADQPWPERLLDPATGWSRLRGVQRVDPDRLKPAAETLASAIPEGTWRPGDNPAAIDSATPAVLTMRYGSGRSIYVATDEIWRWRYGRGEALPERFWLPLVRLAGRGSLARTGKAAVLEAAPTRAVIDQPVQVTLRLVDQSLIDVAPGTIEVTVNDPNEPDAVTQLTLVRTDTSDDTGSYATTWLPAAAGSYVLTASDPLLPAGDVTAAVEVALPDEELRRPEADHALLASLAARTDGEVVPVADLANLPARLPNRELIIDAAPTVEPLWDKPIVLLLTFVLLATEWIGRRLIKLI